MPAKGSGTFPYPGGKTTIAPWIVEEIPDHETYVEVFGGSGSVLMQKPESDLEIFNDINSDITHFFQACRDSGEQIRDWLDSIPYSRELFENWAEQWSRGWRPVDDVERAGQFFYLQSAGFGGHIDGRTFSTQKNLKDRTRNGRQTKKFRRMVENPGTIQNRFSEVIVENLDYRDLLEKYDGADVFFYLDPPYVGCEQEYYDEEDHFDHSAFFNILDSLSGKWMVSYSELPPEAKAGDYTVHERERTWSISHAEQEEASAERLVMNYDPKTTPMLSTAEQLTLTEMT